MTTALTTIMIAAGEIVTHRLGESIEELDGFRILPKIQDNRPFMDEVRSLTPDIIVIETGLPDFDWITAVHEIKSSHPPPGVLVLTETPDDAALLSAFREGADAYLLSDSQPETLVSAVAAIREGRTFFFESQAAVVRRHMQELELGRARKVTDTQNGIVKLTVREKEIFPLLADGKSIKQIAKIMGLSPKTVETHKYHILGKLNLDNVCGLTKLAVQKDLLPL